MIMKALLVKRISSIFVITAFLCINVGPLPEAHASIVDLGLPLPGAMVNLSSVYEPALIKGLTIHKDNPFLFDFILDTGHSYLQGNELKQEGDKLVKYFFASLTIPEKDLWVNLSPYEKDRIVPQALGETAMGKDLLAQDYILKQLTASLIYPEKGLGKTFWDRVYAQSRQKFGNVQVPVNTFNKVWILADKATVYEHNQTAFVVEKHLKVMLEEDYLALEKNTVGAGSKPAHERIASQIIRQIIIPEIEKEVNAGKNFAPLRQIYNSLILASWYKKNLKNALLTQVYADKSTVNGINGQDPEVKEKIYKQYLQAYKKGVFNYIKEDIDQKTKQATPRKYFSGGFGVNERFVSQAMVIPEGFNFTAGANVLLHVATVINSAQWIYNSGDGDTGYNLSDPIPLLVAAAVIRLFLQLSRKNDPRNKAMVILTYDIIPATVLGLAGSLLWRRYSRKMKEYEVRVDRLVQNMEQYNNSGSSEPYYITLPPIRLGSYLHQINFKNDGIYVQDNMRITRRVISKKDLFNFLMSNMPFNSRNEIDAMLKDLERQVKEREKKAKGVFIDQHTDINRNSSFKTHVGITSTETVLTFSHPKYQDIVVRWSSPYISRGAADIQVNIGVFLHDMGFNPDHNFNELPSLMARFYRTIEISPEGESANSAQIAPGDNPKSVQGGIDLTKGTGLRIEKDANGGVKVSFDQALVARICREGVRSVVPVVISVTPVSSVLPLLGLAPQVEQERLAKI